MLIGFPQEKLAQLKIKAFVVLAGLLQLLVLLSHQSLLIKIVNLVVIPSSKLFHVIVKMTVATVVGQT